MASEIFTPAERYAQTGNLPTAVYDANDLLEAVNAALLRYGQDLPQDLVGSFSGDGGSEYDLSELSLTSWDEDSSSLVEVAAPWSVSDQNVLGFDDWIEVEDPTNGRVLYLTALEVEATDTIRVRYTAPWTQAAVPTKHVSAVAMLAAAFYLRMMAARFAQSGESTIGADVFNRNTASQSFRNLARDYLEQYGEIVNIETGADAGPQAAIGFAQIDVGGNAGLGPLIDPSEYED